MQWLDCPEIKCLARFLWHLIEIEKSWSGDASSTAAPNEIALNVEEGTTRLFIKYVANRSDYRHTQPRLRPMTMEPLAGLEFDLVLLHFEVDIIYC